MRQTPQANSPGMNQPGTGMTPRQRQVRRAVIAKWVRIIKNYLETIEQDMDYTLSNQPIKGEHE